MRRVVTMIVAFVLGLLHCNAFALDVGSNINEYYKQNSAKFDAVSKIESTNRWPENTVSVRKASNPTGDNVFAVLTTKDNEPFAAGVDTPKGKVFIYDMDGDGLIDFSNENLIIPFWIVTHFTSGKKEGNQFIKLMDELMQTFQSDQGPVLQNFPYQDSLSILKKMAQDPSQDDRDLAYAFTFYSLYRDESPSIAIACIFWIGNRCIKRFGEVHPLVLLYTAETAMLLDKVDQARSLTRMLLERTPSFIPALVLDYRT